LNELSKQILSGQVNKNDHISLDVNNKNEFVFKNVKAVVDAIS
jgi:hypothetical protein